MSRRQLKSDDVDGFVMAFWDEVVDCEKLYNVKITMDLRLKPQRGQLTFFARAEQEQESGPDRLVACNHVSWPTDKATTLHALLYRLAMGLNRLIQDDYHDRTGHWYSSPADSAGTNA